MTDWNRVWSNQGCNQGCPSSCYNFAMPQENCSNSVSSSQASLLEGLNTSVTTCAAAVDFYAAELQQRIGAQSVIVSSGSDILFTFTIRMRRKRYTATLAPANGCKFPVTATCTVGGSTHSADFQSMTQVLDWWIDNLK